MKTIYTGISRIKRKKGAVNHGRIHYLLAEGAGREIKKRVINHKYIVVEKDNGPISVVFGSAHTKMPSIKSVKEEDVIYPVTVSGGTLCVLARLPVEKIEPAYEYLIREVGSLCGALVSEEKDWNWREFYKNAPIKPYKCHRRPFNCCSETAAVSAHGSSIELRPIPKEKLPQLMFGPTKAKQKPMMLGKDISVWHPDFL